MLIQHLFIVSISASSRMWLVEGYLGQLVAVKCRLLQELASWHFQAPSNPYGMTTRDWPMGPLMQ